MGLPKIRSTFPTQEIFEGQRDHPFIGESGSGAPVQERSGR